jgi:hypothetical protein
VWLTVMIVLAVVVLGALSFVLWRMTRPAT